MSEYKKAWNREYQENFKRRMKKLGYVRQEVWIKKKYKEAIKKYAQTLNELKDG